MNDYTNLIYQLRECAEAQNQELLRDAANAIERLVKERDAAVAALKRSCSTCRNEKFCVTDVGFPILAACVSSEKCNWTWRGVQEDNDG